MSETKYRQLRRSAADDIPGTVRRIFSYLNQYKVALIVAFVCIIIEAVVTVASSAFFTPLIDNYIVPLIGSDNPDLSGFIRQLIIMGIVFVAGVAAAYIYRKIMSLITTAAMENMRRDLFNHMQDMPVSFYDTNTNGELMNFYTNDIDTIRPLISDTLPSALNTILSVGGSIIMMIILSPLLTTVTFGLLVMVLWISVIIGKRSRKYFVKIQKSISDICMI